MAKPMEPVPVARVARTEVLLSAVPSIQDPSSRGMDRFALQWRETKALVRMMLDSVYVYQSTSLRIAEVPFPQTPMAWTSTCPHNLALKGLPCSLCCLFSSLSGSASPYRSTSAGFPGSALFFGALW